MRKCIECGSTKNVYSKAFGVPLCGNCTKLWKDHPQHDIPLVGEIAYDEMGRPICHVCGRAFDKLLTHAKQRHNMSAAEYKEKFGLDSTKGVISEKTRTTLHNNVMINYDKVVVENLKVKGEGTRFKKGNTGRTKDKVRLQTKNRLTEHIKSVGPGRG